MPAVGLTYLQVVNKVLVRLRRDTMANFSSPTALQTLIMDLVNTVKDEIQDAWRWSALRDTYTITTATDTIIYSFTGAGANAEIIDGFNATYHQDIQETTNYFMDQAYLVGVTVPQGPVTHYVTNSVDNNYDIKIDVYPRPNGAQTLNFNLYVRQADFTVVGDIPKVPVNVLIEGTLAYALLERGDESADKQMARYQFLLSNAVAADVGKHQDEVDFVPV